MTRKQSREQRAHSDTLLVGSWLKIHTGAFVVETLLGQKKRRRKQKREMEEVLREEGEVLPRVGAVVAHRSFVAMGTPWLEAV